MTGSRPTAAARWSQRLHDLFTDLRLGIRTRGRQGQRTEEVSHYSTISYHFIERILDRLELRSSDVTVDLGSGKGRFVCAAARRRIATAIGVELSSELCAIARENARNVRGRAAPIEIVEVEAQRFDYDRGNVYYLFDPFGPETIAAVLSRLADSIARSPRAVRLAYVNPRCEDLFGACAAITEVDRWQQDDRGTEHTVVFYASRPRPT